MLRRRLHRFSDCRILEDFFEYYGTFVATHPLFFIIVPLILTFLLSLGAFCFTSKDDLRFLYTQSGSPSLSEYEIAKKFYNISHRKDFYQLPGEIDHTSIVYVLFWRSNSRNLESLDDLLREDTANLILDINSYILQNFSVKLTSMAPKSNSEMVNFGKYFCGDFQYCKSSNEAVKYFFDAYFDPATRYSKDIQLTYPVMYIFRSKIFMAGNFYGVESYDNRTVDSFKILLLSFAYNKTRAGDTVNVENDVEKSLDLYLKRRLRNSTLKYELYSLNILKNEITKNTWYTIVYVPFSITALVFFVLFTSSSTNQITSKPLESLCGLATSILAIFSAMGLLFAVGLPYNSTISVMPFLTLALAVDDTFIILAAWHRTDRKLSPERRMGLALRESGSAISVTALTDVFSFVIGACADSPAISAFCQFTAVAITFDYIYQFTFFCGIASLGARREAAHKHCIIFWRTVHKNDLQVNGLNPIERLFKSIYVDILMLKPVQIVVLTLYLAFLAVSFWGCTTIRVNLTPNKILVSDSPLNTYITLAQRYVWKQALIGTVFVNRSPDFRNASQRALFLRFVDELENGPFSMGQNSTMLWYREYEKYLKWFKKIDDKSYYRHLRKFLKLASNKKWAQQIIWKDEYDNLNDDKSTKNPQMEKFTFISGYSIDDWIERTRLVQFWRSTCQKNDYAFMQSFVYNDDNFYVDQMDSLAANTVQDCGIAFFCMALVCAVFIRQWIVLFWVLWSLFAMNLNVIGVLAWWGCDLDPSSVTSILMSVGLTVDFTAHVGYHFSNCECKYKDEKLRETLSTAGWPLIQGAISTLLSIFALLFVRSYTVQVFFKTVVVVVASGLVHALLFLPVLFVCTVDLKRSKQLGI